MWHHCTVRILCMAKLKRGATLWMILAQTEKQRLKCWCTEFGGGAIIFFRRGVPNLQKVSINIIVTPLFWQQKFYDPHHWYTLRPKQAKIVLKSSLFEQNTHTIWGHLVTPYILVIKNFMTRLFFFPKNFRPPSKENDNPLRSILKWDTV